MIKLADYTEKLDRLHNSKADPKALDTELSRVCMQVFGADLYDIDDKALLRLLGEAEPYGFHTMAIQYARQQGFEIAYSGGPLPLPDWKTLTIMIMARERNILTPTSEGVGNALSVEAACFRRQRQEEGKFFGKVKWFNAERGYGFIALSGPPQHG